MKAYLRLIIAAAVLVAARAYAAPITLGQSITAVSAGTIFPSSPGDYSGNLVNEAGLAYSNTYLLDMAQYDAREVSVVAIFSTVTYTNPTVSDGSESTDSFRVVTLTGLSSATATDQVTITTNNFGGYPTLTVRNCSLLMGRDWLRGATRNATASNLAAAIHACAPEILASATGNVVYATATYGSYANAYAFTSDNSSVTVATALMSGGADNACLTINGTALCNQRDWQAGASTAAAVLSLGNAIANASLSISTKASGSLGVIYATSTLNGTAYNYAVTTSSPTVLSVSNASFTGGLDSGFTLGSKKIKASAAGMTLGLPFLYAIGSNPAIGGLTTGTTYYAVPAGGTNFFFSKYSSSAVAGLTSDYATVSSTNSGFGAHTYTLAPLGWAAGTATYIWQTSNDGATWTTAPSTGTVTISTTAFSSPVATNFGVLGYRYLRLNFTAPSGGGGAVALQVPVYLKQE